MILSPYNGRVLQGHGSIPRHCRHRGQIATQTLVSLPKSNTITFTFHFFSRSLQLKHLSFYLNQTPSLSLFTTCQDHCSPVTYKFTFSFCFGLHSQAMFAFTVIAIFGLKSSLNYFHFHCTLCFTPRSSLKPRTGTL